MKVLKRISVESILVMFLFILFTGCIGVLIVQGRDSYETIISHKTDDENMRIAYSYISKRIKQNNIVNCINVIENPYNEYKALDIKLSGQDEGYSIIIFSMNDELVELYQLSGDPINVEQGEKLIEIPEPISFSLDEKGSIINIISEGQETASIKILERMLDYEK
jgi:hypothetical protein